MKKKKEIQTLSVYQVQKGRRIGNERRSIFFYVSIFKC